MKKEYIQVKFSRHTLDHLRKTLSIKSKISDEGLVSVLLLFGYYQAFKDPLSLRSEIRNYILEFGY
jgi:hypothetical protein